MPSEQLLKVGLAGLLLPLFNSLFLFWAHNNAYRRGHLAAGTLLGVTLGPLGALFAEFLPRLGRPSAAILAQLDERENSPHGTWATGLVCVYLGTAVAGGVLAAPLFGTPYSTALGLAAVVALLLVFGGSSLVVRGLPPARLTPPLSDAQEYEADYPEFAAALERDYREYQLSQRAGVFRQAASVAGGVAVIAGLIGYGMVTADDPVGSATAVNRGYGWASLVLAAVAGVTACLFHLRRRDVESELSLSSAESAAELIPWHPAIPLDLRSSFLRATVAAQEAYERHIQLREWSALLISIALICVVKAVGGLFGLAPVTGTAALWFLLGVPLAALALRWQADANSQWYAFEDSAWQVGKHQESINALLPADLRESSEPPPPRIDSALEVTEVCSRCARIALTFALISFGESPGSVGVWLLLALPLWLFSNTLARRLQADLIERGLVEPAPATELPATSIYADAEAATEAPAQTEYVQGGVHREWMEYVEQQELLQRMGLRYQELTGQLRLNSIVAAGLAYIGVGTLAWALHVVRIPPEYFEPPKQLSPWPPLLLVAGLLLLLFRGRIEDQLVALPQQFIRADAHRNFAAAQAHGDRLARGLRLRQKMLWTALVVLAVTAFGRLALLKDGASEVLSRLAPVLLATEITAAVVIGVALIGIVSLRKQLLASRRYAASLVETHVREEIAAEVERRRAQSEELIFEDHGHFTVQYPDAPPPEFVERYVKRRVHEVMDRDPLRVVLDVARSLCYLAAMLICAWDFITRPIDRDPILPASLLMATCLLWLMGLLLGLVVRLRSQA